MMPRASNGVAIHHAFGERAAIVRTGGRDRKDFSATTDEEDGIIAGVTEQRAAIGDIREGNSLSEIGPRGLGVSAAHLRLLG